jgi:hypothetical protein
MALKTIFLDILADNPVIEGNFPANAFLSLNLHDRVKK